MKYAIVAHPTWYAGVLFRSRLEARYAALFDLVGWKWQYEPFDLEDWTPDFRVEFPCDHGDCEGKHALLVEVKPYLTLAEFEGHPCQDYPFGGSEKKIPADASAAFGNDPSVTSWDMAHGSGGGTYAMADWVKQDVMELWKVAGRLTQYRPPP
jgi:hypothetical protein